MEGKGWSLVVKKIIIGCERIGLKNITLIVGSCAAWSGSV